MRALLVSAVLVLGGLSLPAQQRAPAVQVPSAGQATFDTRETRDPAQTQDEDFAQLGQGVDDAAVLHQPAGRSPAEGARGFRRRRTCSGHHIGAPATLTYYADILKYYRALAAATPRVQDRDDRQVRRGPRARRRLGLVGREHQEPADRTATTSRRSPIRAALTPEQIQQLHRDDQAALPPDGRAAQRRDRAVRDADGAGLPARDRDVAAHQADPRQRDRLGHAGGRSRRPRSQRRLVLPATASWPRERRRGAAAAVAGAAGAAGCRRPAAAAAGGGGGARRRAGCRTGASTSIHDNNRDINLSQVSMRAHRRLVLHRASADHARPARGAAAALHLQRRPRRRIPNLDPILFAELPLFSNFELAQMTKWGMPGVYTHAFMDGWSPGYLGSVAYNHNGMMRMYETQSARERRGPARGGWPAATWRGGRGRDGGAAEAAAAAAAAPAAAGGRSAARRRAVRAACAAAGAAGGAPTGTRRRPAARVVSRDPDSAGRARQLVAPQQHQLHGDRRALGPAAHGDRSRTWSSRTSTARRRTRSTPARPRRRTATSFRCSAT